MAPTGKLGFDKGCQRFIQGMIYIGMLVGVAFFAHDVWVDYRAKVTSTKHYSEVAENLRPPIITMCFSPFLKPEVLKDLNLTQTQFKQISNLTLYQKASYQLEKDFKMVLREGSLLKAHDYQVEEISTFWMGQCFKITIFPTLDMLSQIRIEVMMKKHMKSPPKINWFFTSEQNSYGVVMGRWLDGSDILRLETKMDESHRVMIRAKKYKKLKAAKNCSNSEHPLECSSKMFIDVYNNLTCLPIQLKTIQDLSKIKVKKETCPQFWSKQIMKYWQKLMVFSYRKCLKPCNILEYQGSAENTDKIRPGKIQISLSLSTDEVKVQEEYLIYNEVDLVGIIGGTMGLFIGFSFFDIVNDVIAYILKCFSK